MSGPARLRDQDGRLGAHLRAASALSHPEVARARVWQRLQAQPRPPRTRLALAGALALALLLAMIWPRPVATVAVLEWSQPSAQAALPLDRTVSVPGFALLQRGPLRAAVGGGSLVRVDLRGFHLEAGAAAFSVQSDELLRIAVGSAWVALRRGGFIAESSAARTVIFAREGRLLIETGGQELSLEAGHGWASQGEAQPGADAVALAARLEGVPAPQRLARLERAEADPHLLDPRVLDARALEAERGGRLDQAAALLAQLAQGDGPRAANALYELARLRLRDLHQPKAALDATAEYASRFPDGALLQEAALTGIEARVELLQGDLALAEMDAFLRRFPGSERESEVRWLRASLLLQRRDCTRGRTDLEALARDPAHADDAAFALAGCAPAVPPALRDYLRRFPSGRHAASARAQLDSGE